MDKRALIEELVETLSEGELRSIVEMAIQAQRERLGKLEQLSSQFSTGSRRWSSALHRVERVENIEDSTAKAAMIKILGEAEKPLLNAEIRGRYEAIYGKKISSSTVGNTLWRDKDKLFKKSGKGTRWIKWEFIKGEESLSGILNR